MLMFAQDLFFNIYPASIPACARYKSLSCFLLVISALHESTKHTAQTNSAKRTLDMPTTDIRSLSQYKELIESNHVVIINAWAKWCGPCRIISPDFESCPKTKNTTSQELLLPRLILMLCMKSLRSLVYAFNNGTLERALMGANPGGLEQLVKEATSKVESN